MVYGKPGGGKRKSLKKKPVQKTVNKDGSITFIKKASVRRPVKSGSIQGPRKVVKTKVTVAQMKPKKRKTLYVAAPKKNRNQS
jgi:hypothetical protein